MTRPAESYSLALAASEPLIVGDGTVFGVFADRASAVAAAEDLVTEAIPPGLIHILHGPADGERLRDAQRPLCLRAWWLPGIWRRRRLLRRLATWCREGACVLRATGVRRRDRDRALAVLRRHAPRELAVAGCAGGDVVSTAAA